VIILNIFCMLSRQNNFHNRLVIYVGEFQLLKRAQSKVSL